MSDSGKTMNKGDKKEKPSMLGKYYKMWSVKPSLRRCDLGKAFNEAKK